MTLPYLEGLKCIDLENTGMKDEQAALILRACSKLRKLKVLKLGQNTIAEKFFESLKKATVLQESVVEFSIPKLQGATRYFASILEQVREYIKLQELDISFNVLSADAARALARLLSTSTTLVKVNLSQTLYDYQATRIVLSELMQNTTLEYLNLSLNRLHHPDFEFVALLGRMVLLHPSLRHLDISFSQLTLECLLYICLNLIYNKTITSIHLGQDTHIDYYGRLMLRHAL